MDKLNSVGLVEQKTDESTSYKMTFYFSQSLRGNEIWWWKTYRNFFKDDVVEPKNIFYFGVLICAKNDDPEKIYLISLGKSHFYLSGFIELDFGINLAVRMADEDTVLLKKSRYFAGAKRQDISSYENFIRDNYDAGESVDHLKLKALDKEMWGDKNIIFSDSVQMDIEKTPLQLGEVFDYIDACLTNKEVIRLPKLETVSDDDLSSKLDEILLSALREKGAHVLVEEFQVYGVNICFNFHDYNYQISTKDGKHKKDNKKDLGNSLDIENISGYLLEHAYIDDLNSIRIQFKSEEAGVFTKGLKDVVDFHVQHEDYNFFIKNGCWFKFNQTFMDYLKRSLARIEIIYKEDLIEREYVKWRKEKELKIENGEDIDNKITYREYYFNKMQSINNGYLLLDRQLTQIQSLNPTGRKYNIEIADLYKNNEVVSVKISEDVKELIYNIEQSKDSIEFIMRKEIDFEYDLNCAALWFVFDGDVKEIIQINSIQFLLAVEAWQKQVRYHGLIPKIYLSKHDKS